jgi:16S rRNA (cytosine967-C5)-methyltransferase
MKFLTLINHSAELVRLVLKSHQPADLLAREYFRSRKYIGSKERKYISELVYSNLRLKSLSDYCAEDILSTNPRPDIQNYGLLLSLIATNVIGFEYPNPKPFDTINSLPAILEVTKDNFYDFIKISLSELIGIYCEENKCLMKTIVERFEYLTEVINFYKSKDKVENSDYNLISIYYSIPEWIVEKVFSYYGDWNSFKIIESLLYPAPLVLRINTSLTNADTVFNIFNEMGIDFQVNPVVDNSIVINKRVKIDDSEVFKTGLIEVQDSGSQIISYILDPQPGSRILDACAGAGGKTLHIASLVEDNAEIIAADVELPKLKELNKRAKRASLNSIRTYLFKGKSVPEFEQYFDYVLVDAPCSGMGTIRRIPMLKWRLTEKNLEKYQKKQIELINRFSKFVKPGGTLVYSTCSLMPDENEDVVKIFLAENQDFKLIDNFNEELDKYNIKLRSDKGFMTLFPFTSASDVFFVAKFERQ